MICKICNKNYGRTGGSFNKHLLKEHNIHSYVDYIIYVDYNNIKPLCACGCGQPTNYANNEFKKFIHGHNYIKKELTDIENKNINQIINLYKNENKSGYTIAKLLNLKPLYVYNIIKKNNITKTMSEAKRIYKLNESVFENIDNEEKAYWLGFLYADGYNYTNETVTLCLANKDINILYKLLIFFETNKGLTYNNINSKKVVINSKKISNDLIKLGMIQNKTHVLCFPNIAKHLENHFIRGYFDGDGGVSYGRKLKKNKNLSITITSTMNFLKIVENKINIHFSYSKRHKNKNDSIYTITTGGINNIMYFYYYLYNNSSIYMERKKNKFDKWIKFYFKNYKSNKKTIINKNILGFNK